MSDNFDMTRELDESDESKLANSVTRLGDTAEQLTDVLIKVDENQKTLLKLRFDVVTLRDKTEMETVRLDTANQIAKVRNKTAVLVVLIMLVSTAVGAFSYTRIRAESNAADAATISAFATSNRCQIDFNTKVLAILRERGRLDGEGEVNMRILLEKIAIPGSSFEQGQTYRRDYVAKSIAIQAERDTLVFPKTNC